MSTATDVEKVINTLITKYPEKQFTIVLVGGEAFAPEEHEDVKEDFDTDDLPDDVDFESEFFKEEFLKAIFGNSTVVGGGGGGGGSGGDAILMDNPLQS